MDEKTGRPHIVECGNAAVSVNDAIRKHAQDPDEAMKAFEGRPEESLELDEATNRRLLRRIDLCLLPIMCMCHGLNHLDKSTISYASVMGIKADIGLRKSDYQWLGSVFYFGYLAFELPAVRILQRFRMGKFAGLTVIVWGAILACFAAVNNFDGAVALRFFLGAAESAISPAFVLITSQWYTVKEQGLRVAIWFSFNGLGHIFGGLVAYAIARRTSTPDYTGLAGWRILFLLAGTLTMVLGIFFVLVIPDSPLNARWLSKRDRLLALVRIRNNGQGVGNKHFKWHQLRETFRDPMTWAFIFYGFVSAIPAGGMTAFFSQLITSFGYTSQQSLLYGTAAGGVEVVSLLLFGFLSIRFGHRLLVSASGLAIGILGMSLIVGLPLSMPSGRLVGYYLTSASATGFVGILSLISSNIAGYTKKTMIAALYLIANCTGNIIGPQTFRPKDAPRYAPAEITIIVCRAICLLDVLFIYFYYRHQNKLKARFRARPAYERLANIEWLDLTDRENPEFVYTL